MADPNRFPGATMKRTIKDSVFTSLFSDRRNVYELYRGLHPEDADARVEDVEIVTVQNALTNDQHNDLGFIVGDRLLILVEAQSTWSPNIALRAFLYTAQTLKNLVRDREIDIYSSRSVDLPRPELYVVYTGARPEVPERILLSEVHGWGPDAGIEAMVRVISEAGPSMSGQYVDFARTMDAYRLRLGPTEEAIREAIANCRGRGVLGDWLASHEHEVVNIMMALYDEREVLHNYIAATAREARAEGRTEGEAAGIVAMCREFGLSAAQAAERLAARLGIAGDEAVGIVRRLWPAGD